MSNNIHTKVSRTLQTLLKQKLIADYELIPTDTHLLKIKLKEIDVELTYTYLGLLDLSERDLFSMFRDDIAKVIEENILSEVKKIIEWNNFQSRFVNKIEQ